MDLDNTLYEFGAAESEGEAHIAEKLSKKTKIRPQEILKVFNEVKRSHMHHDTAPEKYSRELWFKETFDKLGKKKIDAKKIEKEYWAYIVPRIKLFPNTLSVLSQLKEKYKIATITDSDGERETKIRRVKALGLDKYFDYIITTDDTGKNKPAIENWGHLLKISGMKGKECMMVGDHPDVDLINARKLGFITVWSKEHINTDMHFNYVDYEIHDIGELLKIVERYN